MPLGVTRERLRKKYIHAGDLSHKTGFANTTSLLVQRQAFAGRTRLPLKNGCLLLTSSGQPAESRPEILPVCLPHDLV